MKNISIFNAKSYKAFLKFLYRKIRILSYVFALILIFLGVGLIFFNYGGYIYILFGVSLPIFVYVFLKLTEIEAIKNNTLLKYQTIQTYTFEFDSLHLSQESQLGIFEDNYFYNEFLQVVKTKQYYYFFINRAQALIVDISGFKDGDDKKLDDFLVKSINDKFINKTKKYKNSNGDN